MAFQGSGTDRTLTVTAANAVGTATITLSVNDGSGNTRSTNFGVSVVARPAQLVYLPFEAEGGSIVAPMQRYTNSGVVYIGTTSSQQGTATVQFSVPVGGNYIIWARNLSVDSGHDSFFVSMDGSEVPYHTALETWSSNWQWTRVNIGTSIGTVTDEPRVFGLSSGTHTLVFRGREANCTLDQFIICNDLDFVPGMNTAPTISSIPDQTIAANTSTGNLPLTIGDAESNPADLTLSADSSNQSLVPLTRIVFGGSGSNRTVNVTPATNQSGTATISVTVSDGSRYLPPIAGC